MDAPVGTLPLPILPNPEPGFERCSAWPAKHIGKRGERTVDPEAYLKTLNLPLPTYVAIGSVSAVVYRNSVQRPPHLCLPKVGRVRPNAGAGAEGEDEEAGRIEIPEPYSYLGRNVVPLGKFGLAEDFSFETHNETDGLTALDNTVPNCYCNVVLVILYELPWTRAHCLSSLTRSQFSLSDELGFLFSMMDRSIGSACQPRNFQRALHQSREATALKLVDAVDIEGNVKQGSEGLPAIICKFVAFLLDTLSKEARAAAKSKGLASAHES